MIFFFFFSRKWGSALYTPESKSDGTWEVTVKIFKKKKNVILHVCTLLYEVDPTLEIHLHE